MTRARALFLLALAAFLGWLAWLGYAVYAARYASDKSVVLSRAQLTAATHLIVAEVGAAGDVPDPVVKVVEVVKGADGPPPGSTIKVLLLGNAKPPGPGPFPGPGTYLLPLVFDGRSYAVAELPRSPGYEPAQFVRPPIYHWTDDTRAQLRELGVVK